ncbi:D-alanyl-D-alanine carboxypeptidase [Kineococcus xinjiangensis]|uniref:D-alanyl-D-alanine carboxypeptidase n=1 Tax=Kineococcus xinjiangensis TaxID=512762 RepID=A0A2S6IWE8_9ACTN|nr:serine hydrolase domain-containing protein [Kineococcus xinjiangensis]PPK98682.1 D-alanyl-D-alanine carboxypeptidase [Kineococcus xinjiangensis]
MRTTRSRRRLAGALTAAMMGTGALTVQAAGPAAAQAAPTTRSADRAAGPRSIDRAAVQRALDEMAASGAQGVQVRITDGHRQVVLRSGTAEIDSRRPVPRRGTFRIGSITKTFVATVVLQLVGEGSVELDAPVSRYLPGLLPDGDRITVRMLLQHTSGLANYTDHLPLDPAQYTSVAEFKASLDRRVEPAELVALAAEHPLHFEPGTGWRYSNTGYVVLGMLVAEVTGQPYDRAVEERILHPLRLRSTSVPGDRTDLPGRHAHGYARVAGQVVNVTELDPSVASAAGEMVSTTADLDRFVDALLDGRVLAPAQLAEMQRTSAVSPGYGLGVESGPLECGVAVQGHGGGIHGFSSLVLSTPDTRKRLVVSLTSAPDAGELRGYAELLDEAFCA